MTKGMIERHFRDLKAKFREGARFSVHGNKGKFKDDSMEEHIIFFTEKFVEDFGDYQPDCTQIHLHSTMTKRFVYEELLKYTSAVSPFIATNFEWISAQH